MSFAAKGEVKVSSHYSRALEPEKMHSWAEAVAPKLINLLRSKRSHTFPVLVYTGMSGISHAAHLSGELCQYEDFEFGQIYVRKEGEVSHGLECEWHLARTEKPLCLVFVDDFVGAGATLKRVLSLSRRAARERGFKVSSPVVTCLYSYDISPMRIIKKYCPKVLYV